MIPTPDRLAQARTALACLDLTSLGDNDTEPGIASLCARAQGRFGPVAAVCVWPRFAHFARRLLPSHIAVAAVANFPDGGDDTARAVGEAQSIVRSGAQEVDLVLPYRRLLAGDEHAVASLLHAVRQVTQGLVLKVILETGELRTEALVRRASEICLAEGADFLKTSTGKSPVGATPAAARTMLQAIADDASAARRAGFKASGGVRTVVEASTYISMVSDILGPHALVPTRLRIGASSLLDDIEALLCEHNAPEALSGPAVNR